MVVNKVATVAALVLVEIGLGDGLVGEVRVFGELENEAETRLVEILHADIGKVLEGAFVTVCDHLGERNLVLHGGEPELGNTSNLLGGLGGLLGLHGSALLLLLIFAVLASLNLGLGGLGSAIYNSGPLLVEGSELGKVLLLKLEDLFLELSLKLGVLLLDTLQACDAALDLGRERLDIAGGTADERAKAALDQVDKLGILSKDGGGSGTIQILC